MADGSHFRLHLHFYFSHFVDVRSLRCIRCSASSFRVFRIFMLLGSTACSASWVLRLSSCVPAGQTDVHRAPGVSAGCCSTAAAGSETLALRDSSPSRPLLQHGSDLLPTGTAVLEERDRGGEELVCSYSTCCLTPSTNTAPTRGVRGRHESL